MVIWFQGCSVGCPGCFNPLTHDRDSGFLMPVDRLARRIQQSAPGIEGITISGGEPMEQLEPLQRVLAYVKKKTPLSVVLFSGYTYEEILRMPHGGDILDLSDVLIAGRFVESLRLSRGLLGSSNQRIHLLTECYSKQQINEVPESEISIESGGLISVTGLDPPTFSKRGSLLVSSLEGDTLEEPGRTCLQGEGL